MTDQQQRDAHCHPDWFWHPWSGHWWNNQWRRWWSPLHGWLPPQEAQGQGQGQGQTSIVGWCDIDEDGEAALKRGDVLHFRGQAVPVPEPPPVTPEDKLYFENAALTMHKRLLDRRVMESLDAVAEAVIREENERIDGAPAFQALLS